MNTVKPSNTHQGNNSRFHRTLSASVMLTALLSACANSEDYDSTPSAQQTNFPVGNGPITNPQGPNDIGDPATWTLQHPSSVFANSTELTINVTRISCAGGVTGDVWLPEISYEVERIVIIARVAPLADGAYDCQGNNSVPAKIQLREAIGDRILVDGICLIQPYSDHSYCGSAHRWQ